MSSRIPLPYAPKVLELFQNPQNLGKMEDATIYATAGSPACGDMIAFYLKIEERTEVITKSSFDRISIIMSYNFLNSGFS